MKNLNVLIVDDEAPARKKVFNFLQKESQVNTINEASNGIEAIRMIKDNPPDLVLLDIQMPGKTGFEVIEILGVSNMPPLIFITAYDQFALQAFEVQAIDYLLKPFDRDRFKKVFDRALQQIQLKNTQEILLQKLLQQVNPSTNYLDRLMINNKGKFVFIPLEKVLYLKADDKYVQIHTINKKHLIRKSLSDIAGKLNPKHFARIHRSYIVNLDSIKQLSPRSHGDYWVELINEERLILSRRYRDQIFR